MPLLTEKIFKAVEAARHLNEVTDRLNDALARIERGLCALGLGVTASIGVPLGAEAPSAVLSFERDETVNAWRLIVRTAGDDYTHGTPLSKASRRLRIACAGRLGDLLDALVEAVIREAGAADYALGEIEAVAEYIERLDTHVLLSDYREQLHSSHRSTVCPYRVPGLVSAMAALARPIRPER